MAAWPRHLSSGITMEPLRHLSTQSSANRHSQHSQAYCSHTGKKRFIADFILSSRSCSQISIPPLSLSFNSVRQCWRSKVERLPLSPSITHFYTQPSDVPAQHVAVTHCTVAQKLTSSNESSITSATCLSSFTSLLHTSLWGPTVSSAPASSRVRHAFLMIPYLCV